jgi:S1-C subfamily serine protease
MLRSTQAQFTSIAAAPAGASSRVESNLICAADFQRSSSIVPPRNRRELLLASGALLTSILSFPQRSFAASEAESPAFDIAAKPAFDLVGTVGFLTGDNFTALASGVIWTPQGHVVTAYSPVNAALRQDKALVIALQTQSSGIVDYAPVKSITAREPSLDLIVLQADLNTLESENTSNSTLIVARSGDLKIGQDVFLIGSAPDGSRTLSAGVLSATGRSIPAPNGQAIRNALQTDVNVGNGINLGGALVDSKGHLIGIPTVSYSKPGTSRSSGVNFAVGSDTLIDAVPKLIAYGNLSGKR